MLASGRGADSEQGNEDSAKHRSADRCKAGSDARRAQSRNARSGDERDC